MNAGQTPMDRIEMIERSLRCFVYGLIGLLPFLGVPFDIMAVANYPNINLGLGLIGLLPLFALPIAVLGVAQQWRVKLGAGDTWNPAHRYLFWGGVFSRMSLALFFFVPVILAVIFKGLNI
jgi:hypothetical protein